MLLFWMLAGGLALLAALLVSQRAAAARSRIERARDGAEDPALAVHRRQLAELDAQAQTGLLGEAELGSARAEAGRRLLSAAERTRAPERPGARASRLWALAAAVAAVAGAALLYRVVGRPGVADAPYARRLDGWRRASPVRLDAPRMAAVLSALTRERPEDPRGFDYLGRAQMASGAYGEAARAFSRAARLRPAEARFPAQEGEALALGDGGKVEAPAEAAFREALRRDPSNAAARYYLARLRMSRGDVAGGLADWRALAADLGADPRRAALEAEIAAASSPLAGGPSSAQVAAAAQALPAGGAEQGAFIQAMVERLSARLQAAPDDVDGWARLVRAYKVLGDRPAQARALARARTRFARRPDDLARIEAER